MQASTSSLQPDGSQGVASPAFRRFWLANFTVRLGGRIWVLALPIIAIHSLAADAREVGYLASAATLSYLLIGLPAGVWIDRLSKRAVMVVSALMRAALLTAVPLLWWLGALSLPALLCLALLIGGASLFYDIAHQSYLPLLVGKQSSYQANARLEMTSRAANAGGPLLVGLAMKVISAPWLVFLDAVGYLACAAQLARLPDIEERQPPRRERSLRRELAEGVRFVVQQPALRTIASAVVLSNFFATAITTLVPIVVLTTLGLGPESLGAALTAGEVGGLVGASLLGWARRHWGIGTLQAGGLIVAAAFTALVPLAAGFTDGQSAYGQALLMLSLFGSAAGGVFFAVSQTSLRQMLCPKEVMSRVNASMRFVVWGTMPFASVAAGLGAHAFGVVPTLWVAVIGGLLTVLPILGISHHIPPQLADA